MARRSSRQLVKDRFDAAISCMDTALEKLRDIDELCANRVDTINKFLPVVSVHIMESKEILTDFRNTFVKE